MQQAKKTPKRPVKGKKPAARRRKVEPDNKQHREDFERLLDDAAFSKKS
jgi:hypothetical protein